MCRIHVNHANIRSRSQVKVMELSLEFRVRSISPIPLEGFSLNVGHMFALVRQTHNSSMPTQGQGRSSRSQVEPWLSSPIPVERFSSNFGQMFNLVRRRAELILNNAGSRSRSQFKVKCLSLEFRVRSVSPLPLGGFSLNFSQMFTRGTMCRTHNSAMGTQGQGHSSRSRVWALNFVSTRYLL